MSAIGNIAKQYGLSDALQQKPATAALTVPPDATVTPKKPAVPGAPNVNQVPAAPAAAPAPATPLPVPPPVGTPPAAPAGVSPMPNMALPDNQRGAIPAAQLYQPGQTGTSTDAAGQSVDGANGAMWDAYRRLNPGQFGADGKQINDPAGTTHTIGGGPFGGQWDEMQRPGGPVTAGPVTGVTHAQNDAAHPDPSQAIHDASNQWYLDNGVANPELPGAASGAPGAPSGLSPLGAANDLAPSTPGAAPQLAGAPSGLSPVGAASDPLGGATPAANGGVGLSTIDPSNDLRSQSILPTEGVDRYKLAEDRYNQYLTGQEGKTRAASNRIYDDAASRGMAGPGGAGQLRTDLGNLGLQEDSQARNTLAGLLSDATEGTIGDARNNRAEYRGERAYQTQAEKDAYDRERQGVFDEDTLTNSDFNRNTARTQVGSTGNPADILAQIANGRQNRAGGGISDLLAMIQGNAKNGAASDTGGGGIAGILARLFGGGGQPSLPDLPDLSGYLPPGMT